MNLKNHRVIIDTNIPNAYINNISKDDIYKLYKIINIIISNIDKKKITQSLIMKLITKLEKKKTYYDMVFLFANSYYFIKNNKDNFAIEKFKKTAANKIFEIIKTYTEKINSNIYIELRSKTMIISAYILAYFLFNKTILVVFSAELKQTLEFFNKKDNFICDTKDAI